eukprot:gb/GEZN01013045.1/.p1 GENE.gb/GEZN01013045.1/~~gb/GEZN01013045.1/.p1  ORF type:complete len:272 (-),score=47.67 gb/GEZN01013045.1/:93-908(-)
MPVTTRRQSGIIGKADAKSSVVIPAYHEVGNVDPLCRRVFAALKEAGLDTETELIIVDDNSKDGTEEKVAVLQHEGFSVKIIVRTKEKGLSSAVIRGFEEAKGEYLLCMDADLQHPPEKVPELIRSLEKEEFVIGTRYGKGVRIDKDWPLHRRVISMGARALALPLTSLTDPMSGFFGIRKSTFERAKGNKLNPMGYKIAMELYVKSGVKSSAEVPFSFGVRTAGESKLTGKVIVHYLLHLRTLYQYKFPYLLPALVLLVLAFLFLLARAL